MFMNEQEILSNVKLFAIDNTSKDDLHGLPHIMRVLNSCLNLGKNLSANLFILEISALLHDIGREGENRAIYNKNHAEISAEMALDFLKSKNFQIHQEKLDNIIHCIKAHSFSNNIVPETLEAKILSDADKLDALGAIGLYRTIVFTIKTQGGINQVIEHLENKIMKLKTRMNLRVTKKIAEERHQIILDFYTKVRNEV
ncbi:hypothetical protein LCGC14_0639220 [marine sediment metagenome]|uniref:HD domain-containing protein n=1 Tax=marine sediment metagenome TaxID=412755 RepID=A0A0F9TL82_9ZZZZ